MGMKKHFGLLGALLLASCVSSANSTHGNYTIPVNFTRAIGTSQPGFQPPKSPGNGTSIAQNITIVPASQIDGVQYDPLGRPLPKPLNGTVTDPSAYVNTTAYQRCLKSETCQPFHHARGWRPLTNSSQGHNASDVDKRQYCLPGTLQPQYSSSQMFYGTVNPVTAANNAYNLCNEYNCENSATTQSSSYITNGWTGEASAPQLQSMTVQTWAQGSYSSYNERNALIAAVEGMASQGQSWYEDWYEPLGETNYVAIYYANGNNYWYINLESDNCDSSLGWIEIWTDAEYPTASGGCNDVGIITDAIWDFLNYLGPVGGVIAALGSIICL